MNFLLLRGGYNISPEIKITPVGSSKKVDMPNIFGSFSFGGTLNIGRFIGFDASLDYGFIATEIFEDNHIFALRVGF
jgi:hypothetical protein